jgi:hypothetical protein
MAPYEASSAMLDGILRRLEQTCAATGVGDEDDDSPLKLFGDDRMLYGAAKYLGGVLGSDGCIYAIPGQAARVLKIDPARGWVGHIGPHMPGHYKWLRGLAVGDSVCAAPTSPSRARLPALPLAASLRHQVCDPVPFGARAEDQCRHARGPNPTHARTHTRTHAHSTARLELLPLTGGDKYRSGQHAHMQHAAYSRHLTYTRQRAT